MPAVRMYITRGCPHCEAAQKFFVEKKIAVEVIEIGFDPILQAGMRAMSNNQGLPVPVIVSFATQEVVVGNDAGQLERIANATLAANPIASHAAAG